MSEFDFGRFKKKNTTKTLEKKEVIPSPPRVNQPRTPKTAQIDEKKLVSMVGQVIDEKLLPLTETLEKQAISQAAQLPEELSNLQMHVFNRDNLLWRIGTKGERGIKLYELRDFFYPTDAQTIKKMVDTLFSEGLLKKNRHGWLSLRKNVS